LNVRGNQLYPIYIHPLIKIFLCTAAKLHWRCLWKKAANLSKGGDFIKK
jgi:hypothetical protein